MAVTNVDQATLAASWAQKLGAAGDRMKAGAEAIQVAPGQAAAAASGRWLQAVTSAESRFKANVAKVTKEQWQAAYIGKGLPRVASGAQAAQADFAVTLGKILQVERSIVSSLPSRGDVEANIQRSAAFIRAMAATKGQYK